MTIFQHVERGVWLPGGESFDERRADGFVVAPLKDEHRLRQTSRRTV